MDEKEIIKFDITEARLQEIVSETIGIVNVDIDNKEEIEKVKKARISLGKVRVDLQKFGKNKRDWFNAMSKKIIEREKELIAIIEPEEKRLKEFEEEYNDKKTLAERMIVLPNRKEELSGIKDGIEVSDDFILTMDAVEFKGYVNQRIADKNQADLLNLQKKQEELDAKENELKHKEEIRLAEEKARAEEKEKADQREKDRIQKEIDDKKREDDRLAQEKIDLEAKEKAEKDALEKNKKYNLWLKENGYTEKTKDDFVLEKYGNQVRLSKIIGFYTIE